MITRKYKPIYRSKSYPLILIPDRILESLYPNVSDSEVINYLVSVEKKEIDKDILTSEWRRVVKLLHGKNLKSKINTTRIREKIIRGKSELDFLSLLINRLGNKIHVDLVPKTGLNPFRPDYVFIDEETGLHIDIEIDEPYSLHDELPVHYIGSNDEERNTFFLDLNWVVVRFSENQILKYSEKCCDLVFTIQDKLINKDNYLEIDIPEEEKWTYEEALIMCHQKKRVK